MSSKRLALTLTIVSLACLPQLVMTGCERASGEPRHAGEPQHHGESHEATFQATTPIRKDTELVREYVCQIRAMQHIEVRALERGYLQDVYVDEGQTVAQGEPMFQIMPMIYDAERRMAEAEAEFARIEYQNTEQLTKDNVVSPQELALARAKLDKAEAEASLAKAHLTLTEIKAPFDGIMDRLRARRGSLLEEGELLTTLADNSKMWVYFNVTEAEYLDFQKQRHGGRGLPVRLRMANGEVFDQVGMADTIEGDFNNETGTIAFRATFPNPNGLLRHGQTGTILLARNVENALVIPQKATFEILDRRFVYVVDEEHRVRSREIEIEDEKPHLYLVKSGVSETDRILIEGLRRVREGQEVSIDERPADEILSTLDVPAN